MPVDDLAASAPAGGTGADVTATTRRVALLGSASLVGLAVSGCGESGPAPRVAGSTASPTGDRSAPAGDEAVLDAVRGELAGAVALVAATRAAHRTLRRSLAPLEAAHAAQLSVLDPDDETPAAPGAGVPGDPRAALLRLRAAEERLGRRLLTWAVAVDSGPLARVLVAAAAGTAQHLVEPDGATAGGAGTGATSGSRPPGGEGAGRPGADPEALQRVLSAEHAAVWTLGSLGAATSMSATPVLFAQVGAAWEAHRERRDALEARLLAAGEAPVGSRAAYDVPEPLTGPEAVAAAAAAVERVCADAWSFLVASSTGSTRRWAGGLVVALATSAVALGAAPEPLPGAADVLA